jgi:hypothetical protein
MQAGWRAFPSISIRQGGETTLLHAPVFMTERRPNHLPLLMGRPALPGLSILYSITLDILYIYFIYRRPTLYPVEIAVDFLKSL